MRGLTRLERELLHARVAGLPRVVIYAEQKESSVLAYLRRRQLLTSKMEPRVDGEPGLARTNYPTDLGRLALRVCPPEES